MLKIGGSFSYTQIIPSYIIYFQLESRIIRHEIKKAKQRKEEKRKKRVQSGK